MTTMTCVTAQDHLPELAADRLDEAVRPGLDAHLTACGECREVLAALRLLMASRPAVPAGLEARIREAALREMRPGGTLVGATASRRFPGRVSRPVWGFAAAAVLALVMGRTLLPVGDAGPELLALAEGDLPVLLPDDGLVAGGLLLDGLSDDDLALLLEELER